MTYEKLLQCLEACGIECPPKPTSRNRALRRRETMLPGAFAAECDECNDGDDSRAACITINIGSWTWPRFQKNREFYGENQANQDRWCTRKDLRGRDHKRNFRPHSCTDVQRIIKALTS